jgi:hypothetical protein
MKRERKILGVKVIGSHHQLKSHFWINVELCLLATSKLQGPVKVLAYFFKNRCADLWEPHFSQLSLRETTCTRGHQRNDSVYMFLSKERT